MQWFAPFFSGGGYCSESVAFAHALHKSGVRISIVQHGDGYSSEFVDGLPEPSRAELIKLSRRRLQRPNDAVAICHSEPGAWHPPRWPTARCPPQRAAYAVGRTMFETDRLPSGWNDRLNKMDQVWVPTEFARGVFAAGGVEPSKLRVLGEPVDVDFFDPEKVPRPLPLPGVGPETLVFLSIFKWEERKAWDVLLRAFYSEFSNKEDVVLLILTNAYHSSDDFAAQSQELAKAMGFEDDATLPRVLFHDRVDQSDLPLLYAAATAFVLPSRGEVRGIRKHRHSKNPPCL